MVFRKKLSCLWILGLCLVASKSSPRTPTIKDQSFIDHCVNVHNELRGQVEPPAADMKHMTWDEGLAMIAEAWAKQCKFQHNSCIGKSFECHPTFQYIGENIWLGGLSLFSPKSAILAWYNESTMFDYNTLSCSGVCSHYTQVVWANSYKTGCAVEMCPNLGSADTAIFVCDYGPAGNFPNMPPYTQGEPCSLCEEKETCVHKLCRNKELDKPKKYPNWTPQGKALQLKVCNLLCLIYVLLTMF